MKAAQQVHDQENYKNGPESYTGATTSSPTAVAIEAGSATKKQDQQNDQY